MSLHTNKQKYVDFLINQRNIPKILLIFNVLFADF